ncbi:hypothetical protein SuNHUV7_29090 (plasmid) [Pseudoseohaeicola sp. NH-UV-7]
MGGDERMTFSGEGVCAQPPEFEYFWTNENGSDEDAVPRLQEKQRCMISNY